MTHQRLDFDAIAGSADLEGLLAARLGPADRGKWRCPFHDDENPSLNVFRASDRERYKCQACGESGDAIALIQGLDGVDTIKAACLLAGVDDWRDGTAPPRPRPRPRPAPKAPRPPEPEPSRAPDWHRDAEALVVGAEQRLWSREGGAARDWLAWRGVDEATARACRLGWLPRGTRSGELYLHRGVTCPWPHPEGGLAGINVRRLPEGDLRGPLPRGVDKDGCAKGSRRGYLYPVSCLAGGTPVLLVEGELDALIGRSHLGDLVQVVTVGGARQTAKPAALAQLDQAPLVLVALDHDAAGSAGMRDWLRRSPRARRVWLAEGKDLGEAFQRGVDLRAWLVAELADFGWPAPVLSATAPEPAPEPEPQEVPAAPVATGPGPESLDFAGWPADLVEEYEERAAIREYDGGMSREDAERAAYEELLPRARSPRDLFGAVENRKPVVSGRGPYQSGF